MILSTNWKLLIALTQLHVQANYAVSNEYKYIHLINENIFKKNLTCMSEKQF